MSRPQNELSRLQKFFIAFDPGFSNFRIALRGTLSVVLSFLIVSAFAAHLGQPPTLAFLGVIIAMMSALTVSDPTLRQQKLTFLLMPFPASAGMVISMFLEPWAYLRLLVFLVFSFIAVYLRRFGPRWFAVGFVVFMTYFAPMLFPIPQSSMIWVIAAIFVSTAVVAVVRFFIFPDQPQKILKLYLKSFEVRLEYVLKDLADGFRQISDQQLEDSYDEAVEKGRLRIRKGLFKVSELSLIVEQFLNSEDSHAFKSRAEALQISLFERELSIRQILAPAGVLVAENVEPAIAAEIANSIDLVLQDIHRAQPSVKLERALNTLKEKAKTSSLIVQKAVEDFSESLSQVKEETLHPISIEPMIEKLIEEKESENVAPSQAPPSLAIQNGLQPNTKQAIQAALATGLASIGGMALSTERWYWASITAFVIFVGASRGETAVRAFWRVLGTLTGLLFGFALAFLLSGHIRFEWALIVLCVFIGLFSARMTFGFWTATTFTLMVSVLFDLMGLLTPQMFILRLEETLIGSLIGAIVSALVLPISTRSTIRESLAKLLRTIGEVLGELPLGLNENLSQRSLVRKLRAMDQDFFGFRTAAAPVASPVRILKQGELPALMYDISMLTYFVRHLATYKGSTEGLTLEQIRLFCLKLKSELRSQADEFESGAHIESHLRTTPEHELPETMKDSQLAHIFDRIEQILVSLSQRKI